MPPPPARFPPSERARSLIGTTISDRYKVLSLLGEGATGAVYLVEHTVIRRRMALKLLNDERVKNPEVVARFEREALAAAQIHHPNIAAVTDSGRTSDGALFSVFEYADGQSLYDHIVKGPLAAPLALHITRQVASALVRAHAIGIVHRDLKAENIVLVSGGDGDVTAKVLDFGLAKFTAELLLEGIDSENKGGVLTRFGTALGTPAYMAPEQAAGGEVDGRTDLYSLGVLLYEMLTGKLPFECDEPAKFVRLHLTAAVPAIESRVPGLNVPPALEAMVRKLLEKEPEKRFQSAKALLEAIDALESSAALQVGATPPARSADPSSENETLVAPPDLHERLLAQLPEAERTDSLMMTLMKLKDGPGDGAAPLPIATANTPADPPKPKAPSSLEIEPARPEGVADAASPPPESPPQEPAADAGTESANPVNEAGASPAKDGTPSVLVTVRTLVSERYTKLLDWIRARLPEKHRGISQRTLGLSVAVVLALPALLLILSTRTGEDAGTGPAMQGFASEREMEKAVQGDGRDLAKLAVKYPNDSRVIRALARAHLARKDYVGAMRALSSLIRLDPTMAGDDEMIQIVIGGALLPETSDAAISMLESQLDDKGIGVLSDLAERTTTEPLKSKLNASLQKGTTRALASEATLVLLDLRAAPRCEDKRALLKRAGQQGDARTLSYLQAVQQTTTGCGANGQGDCWACLRRGTALQATMDAITKRLGG